MTSQPAPSNPSAPSTARRRFLALTSFFAATAVVRAQIPKMDGGYAPLVPKREPRRPVKLVPPGARSVRDFGRHCTGCQLCVTVCPDKVLRPANSGRSAAQPEMHFDRGYCRPGCTRCADVCPTGAIRHITRAEKSSLQIGHAAVAPERCVVNRDKVHCDACARHCPPRAIHMVPSGTPQPQGDPRPLLVPSVDTEHCIGCGACEFLCPSRPESAIYVVAHERHRFI